MKKKLLTAAISAAMLAGFTLAQADVKIGGTINVSVDSIKGCKLTGAGCTGNSTNMDVSSNASNVVLSASEDLGGSMKGVFSWQEFIRADNNSGSYGSSTAGYTGSLTGGNTYLGISDSWGMITAGNNDSGAKLNGRAFDLFGNQIGDSRNADASNNRMSNLVWYTSPTMSGFSGMIGHATNLTAPPATASPAAVTPDTSATFDNSTDANTLMLKYAQGPFAVGLGYDKLSLGSGVAGQGDKWTNLGGSFTMPTDTTITLFYQKHQNAYSTSSNEIKTQGIGVLQKFGGNNAVKAQYYNAKVDTAGVDGKGKLYAIGFDHYFSKTFSGYLAYAKAKNPSSCSGTAISACMSMAGGGHGDNPGTQAGKNMSGYSVGAIMKF